MKEYLLPENGNFYKANLHSHSTVSDGANTPEQMRDYYREHGYSILALTDHEYLVDHSDLNLPDFLMLTGYEYAFIEKEDYALSKTVELNLFACDPHNDTQVCFDPRYVIHGDKGRLATVKCHGTPDFEREFTLECIQKVIDEANKNGFLVSLNHPGYSMITPDFFGKLKGLFSLEIMNQCSFYFANDYSPNMYDTALRMGNRIGCIAGDDNHCARIYDDKGDPRPWACTVIKCDKLDYASVINALKNGNYYVTQGPEITSLYIEDGKIHFSCSDVKTISLHSKDRHWAVREAPVGEYLNGAVLDVPDDDYFRIEAVDGYGRHACTRAYFLDGNGKK